MDNYNNYYNGPQTPPPYGGSAAVQAQTNAVLRKVYVRMFVGLLITAFCSLGVASSETLCRALLGNTIVYFGIWIGMLVMAFMIPARMDRMSSGLVLGLFCLFSALMGVQMAPVFLVYQIGTISYVFFITAGTFGAMSLYGYFTKADLTKIGTFCMFGLFGLIIACVVNIFVASDAMQWWISIIGVLLFLGLTAWDTQSVKKLARMHTEPAMRDKLATMGAMNLYLDFINLFLFLLRIFGGGRD